MKMLITLATLLFLVIPGQAKQVDLTWDPSPTSGVTYNVYRGTAPGVCGGTKVVSNLTLPSFSDTTVVLGASYVYAISAQNSGGESACTSELSIVIPQPPAPPSNLKGIVR